eukprot:CFRG4764T1
MTVSVSCASLRYAFCTQDDKDTTRQNRKGAKLADKSTAEYHLKEAEREARSTARRASRDQAVNDIRNKYNLS